MWGKSIYVFAHVYPAFPIFLWSLHAIVSEFGKENQIELRKDYKNLGLGYLWSAVDATIPENVFLYFKLISLTFLF